MTKKSVSTIVFLVIAIVVVIVLAMVFKKGPDSVSDDLMNGSDQAQTTVIMATTSATSDVSIPSTTPTTKTYTMAEVAKHSVKSDCWTTVNGSVYNLTPFVGQHPGGDKILAACGIDGTAAFTDQHGGQGRPESELGSLKIGVLAK